MSPADLYRLEAFGLRSEWNLWRIRQGETDGLCTTCKGRGLVVTHPCRQREIVGGTCERDVGCAECLRRCRPCKGLGLDAPPAVLVEDFGDQESYDRAMDMFPGLIVGERKRSDREARAL